MSNVFVNYEVRKDKQSSSNGTSAEALMVRGRGSNRKGERQRSESRLGFKDLKKNQCAFCKEIGHWKVECPRIKDKGKKESKTKANLARVVSTQASTSQADGSDSDSSVFSFSVTTIVGDSGDSEWMLDTRATYHVALTGIDFLALRTQMDVLLSWVMIAHVTWKEYIQSRSGSLMGWYEN